MTYLPQSAPSPGPRPSRDLRTSSLPTVPTSPPLFGGVPSPHPLQGPRSCLHQPSVGPSPAGIWRHLWQTPVVPQGCVCISVSPDEAAQEAPRGVEGGMGALAAGSGMLQTQPPDSPGPQDSSNSWKPSKATTIIRMSTQTHLETWVQLHWVTSLGAPGSRRVAGPQRAGPSASLGLSRHVASCHLVTSRIRLALQALICRKGLCQHFPSESLFSMIYNEASS